MPRQPRRISDHQPHHIVQRGSNRQDVFLDDDDRSFYLDLFTETARKHGVAVVAFCLMSNHVHLVAKPPDLAALARTMGHAHSRYAKRFNKRYGRVGHLWHSRYYSERLDIGHLTAAVRYIERNPVRAGLVERAEDHRWSSAALHCGLRGAEVGPVDTHSSSAWRRRFPPEVWRLMLLKPEHPEALCELRTGRLNGHSVISGENMAALGDLYAAEPLEPLTSTPPGSPTI